MSSLFLHCKQYKKNRQSKHPCPMSTSECKITSKMTKCWVYTKKQIHLRMTRTGHENKITIHKDTCGLPYCKTEY